MTTRLEARRQEASVETCAIFTNICYTSRYTSLVLFTSKVPTSYNIGTWVWVGVGNWYLLFSSSFLYHI